MDPTLFYQPEAYVNVPDERIGLLFVFRVFDRVSYALVLNTTDPVERSATTVRKPYVLAASARRAAARILA